MKLVFFGGSLVGALLVGFVLVHCTSSSGITPVEGHGAGDATLNFDTGGGKDGTAGSKTLGKPCTSASGCGDSVMEACCVFPATGTAKGVCTLRSECGPTGVSSLADTAGAKGSISSGAQLCSSSIPCLLNQKCATESCESPKVSVCSGSNFCSGGTCTTGSECASGKCVNGKCASGACTSDCPPGAPCTSGAECASGVCTNGVCVACTSDCPVGAPCTSGAECASGVCTNGVCAACTSECPGGAACTSGAMCASGVCTDGKCTDCKENCPAGSPCDTMGASASCASGVCTNGKCAGNCTSNCPGGDACTSGSQCASGVCTKGVCAPVPCDAGCPDGDPCNSNAECASGVCTAGKCGSPKCAPNCNTGSPCGDNGDCKGGICTGGFCVASCAPDCTQGEPCGKAGDCYSFICGSDHVCVPPFCSPKCGTNEQCGSNTDCVPPDTCVMGKCTAPNMTCGDCGKVTNDIGSFTCVEKTDPCGNTFNCSCLVAGMKCAECPVSCTVGAKNACANLDAGKRDAPAEKQMCCSLGPGAGGFCVADLAGGFDAGGIDASLHFDAGLKGTSCPPTCNPCGGSCSDNNICCPIMRRNKQAGACVPKPVCPLPQCDPLTCADQGFECGEQSDGCGKPINCGSCTKPGEVCGAAGYPWICAVPRDGGPPAWDAGVDAGFCH